MKNSIPGALLIAALYKEMDARDLTQTDTAAIFGMAKSYLTSLLRGTRSFDGLSSEYIAAIAKFIRVPAVQVRIMAEQIPVNEFFQETTLAIELDVMHERMLGDKAWCAYAPNLPLWETMPLEVTRLVGHLYERVSHEDFLSKAIPIAFVNE